jgi:hypothetical protein
MELMKFLTGKIPLLFSSAAIFVLASFSAQSAILIVTNTNDSGTGSLRDTIARAGDGDTIQFHAALKGKTITLTSGQLEINQALTIEGPGPDQLAVRRSTASGTPAFRIFNIGGNVTLSGLAITNGKAPVNGNDLGAGGGIACAGPALTISNCIISGNSTSGSGGGIISYGSPAGSPTVTISNSTISGNSAVRGAGIYILGPYFYGYQGSKLTITDSTISGNLAHAQSAEPPSGAPQGGGLYNLGQATVTNSTFSDNAATRNDSSGESSGGGAIFNSGALTITNSTISGNSADQGGGIKSLPGFVTNPEFVKLTNSTISDNSAGAGGGLDLSESSAGSFRNTVIATNTSADGPDVKGVFASDGFNLVGNNSGATISNAKPSDQIGTAIAPIDPLLGPLQDNGGPTFTHALLPGSPAKDQGESSGSTSDQRGFERPVDLPGIANAAGGDGADIGAFEVASATLANISTRVRVGTGDNAMIGGFIITGTEPKTVVVRGIGPSLAMAGALADPVIEIYSGDGVLRGTNDNWNAAATRQEIIDSGLAPSNNLESALWGVINPGAYTVVVRGKNDGTGIGLFEVYDVDPSADSKLANISTRGFAETGDNIMIGGFIIRGVDSEKVIIRALGPSLQLPGALANPTLELHDGNGALIVANDDWRSDQEAEIIATTIPPSNDLESAIVRTLVPGDYTAIVRGVNNTTGLALVEVYALN